MSTKSFIGMFAVVAVLAIGVFFLLTPTFTEGALTQDQAINAAIAAHPELASYQTTSLPPSSIETKTAPDGWYLGFIQRGSGVPGILTALCYHVGNAKDVTATGSYTRQGDTAVESVSLDTCAPQGTPASNAALPYGSVTLKLGELATFKDISIRPISIEEDSRCPVDVQCIQAGTVRVRLEVSSGMGTSTSIVKLGSPFTTEGEVITLTEATPAKNSKVQISDSDYRLTFIVVPQGAPVAANPGGTCYIGGCSAQLCTDSPDAISTCEYSTKYACYKTATCERQPSGQCGWTPTAQLTACLANS